MKIRVSKVSVPTVFKRPLQESGKHLTHHHISVIKCLMDDPDFSRLDIALRVGVKVEKVNYAIRKIRKRQELRGEVPGHKRMGIVEAACMEHKGVIYNNSK